MKQFQKTMKLAFIAVFLICMQVSAKVYSQKDKKISIDFKGIKLAKALDKIEAASGCRFFYNAQMVPLNQLVSFTASEEELGEVLSAILAPLNLQFSMMPNKVIALTSNRKSVVVTGIVKDTKGLPLPGVTVKVKDAKKEMVTNINGRFQLEVPDNAVLQISSIGYQSQEINLNGKNSIEVVLLEDNKNLNEVVIVGYGTQKKASTTAAISTLKGDDINQLPVASINNALAGRVSGVLAFQASGEPGADVSSIRVRGVGTTGARNSALTIVDGIPRSISQLSPNEIESITVLKDAAAIAPYGLAGANGVILVTTKRGKDGKVAMGFDTWFGVQRPTRTPDYLNSYDFARTLNAANINAGIAPQYSDAVLQKYLDHSDPDHYPDHDWVKEVIDFSAPMSSQNLTFSGGSEKVRFFSSVGRLYQQGSVNTINYTRYNLATNVDVNATKTTLISLDLKGTLENTKNPGSTSGVSIYTSVTKNPPLLNTQLQFSNGLPGNSLLPSIYDSGYNKKDVNNLLTQLSIEQKLPFVPGLALKAVAAYDKRYGTNKQWQIPTTTYALNAADKFIPTTGTTPPSLSQGFNQTINTTIQGYITYKRNFGKHNISALAVAEQRQGDSTSFGASRINYQVPLDELDQGSSNKNDFDNSGASSRSKQIGFVYRLSYDFNQKYLAEFSGRYDGHYFFAPGKRFAFFPAVSLGWRLSEESFIKDNLRWVTNLKLRGSYGKSGNLAGSAFQYLNSYNLNSSYVFGGSTPTQVSGIIERPEPNVNITWETAKKFDIGIEGSLFGGILNFEADYFKERRSDMLVQPTALLPVEYGIGVSQVNGGIMNNQGVDFSVNSSHGFSNGLSINGGFNFSYAKNMLVRTFENASTFNNLNRRLTGRPLGTQFGYQAMGYFQSQAEIDAAPKQTFAALKPGDIRYADLNGDNKIDENDQTVIGPPAFPQMIYGFTLGLNFKGFDLNMLWQGAAQSSFQLTNEASNPFFNGAKIFKEQLDYWTPDNRDAAYPIILPSPSNNSQVVSSFWQKSGDYLRLKNLELGYSIPSAVIHKLKINTFRVYAAGQNLLTFSSQKFLDPEIGTSGASSRARYYFQQKVFTFGVNATF